MTVYWSSPLWKNSDAKQARCGWRPSAGALSARPAERRRGPLALSFPVRKEDGKLVSTTAAARRAQ